MRRRARKRCRGGGRGTPPLRLAPAGAAGAAAAALSPFHVRHAEEIRHALPADLCFAFVVLLVQGVLGNAPVSWNYRNSPLVPSSCPVILALGQGRIILSGGLDLWTPWTIGHCGILLTGWWPGRRRRSSGH